MYSVWFLKISLPTHWRATGQDRAWGVLKPKSSKRKSEAKLGNSQRGRVRSGVVAHETKKPSIGGVQALLFSVDSKPSPAALLAFLFGP